MKNLYSISSKFLKNFIVSFQNFSRFSPNVPYFSKQRLILDQRISFDYIRKNLRVRKTKWKRISLFWRGEGEDKKKRKEKKIYYS